MIMFTHKHIPYGRIETTITTTLDAAEPLLHIEQAACNTNVSPIIPPLNPDDPLFGLATS